MDNEIKTAVIKDAMILVNINEKKKKEILAQNKKAFIQRSLSSRYVKPSKEEALLKKKTGNLCEGYLWRQKLWRVYKNISWV